MQLVRYIHQHLTLQPSVVCMGNFDGLHLGHQMMLRKTVELAKEQGCLSTVIVFEPQPPEFFLKDKAPARLMRLSDKIAKFAELGVEQVVCLRFNAQLSSMSAEEFIKNVLVNALHMRAIVISEGARFGHKQMGDITLLEKFSSIYHYKVVIPLKLLADDERVSSTRIRQLLADGDCASVARLLGHPYVMTGRIIFGNQLGRTLGFPTINIACQRKTVALSGIFAVHVTIDGYEGVLNGAAHIARRSIVNDQKPLLEVHLFDFNAEVYGKRAHVAFLYKIRDTKSVSDLDELKQLIQSDTNVVKAYFQKQK